MIRILHQLGDECQPDESADLVQRALRLQNKILVSNGKDLPVSLET